MGRAYHRRKRRAWRIELAAAGVVRCPCGVRAWPITNHRGDKVCMRCLLPMTAQRRAAQPRAGVACSFCRGDGFNLECEICAQCNGTGREDA